ncbi:membrane bound O-acyl transferase family-domain-containing protein [Aspergillus granulosus]|uniref:Membrane bound O-acyl transferase family-domain-containing protein n=1 Tax=Aspergillus granulosus TaxID=176169 RepID=A0ABR4GTI6_9EURO
MADYVIQNLASNLQAMQNAYSAREEMPAWATKLLTPTFMAVAVLTTLPPAGPVRVIVGLTAFTSLWLHVLTHWVSGPAFFMDAIFMISITVRWLLMFLAATPEIDYHQTTRSGTTLTYMGTKDSNVFRRVLTKMRWSVELWSCWRGQGWNFVDQHLPRGAEQKQSRWEFLVSNAGRVLLNQYISDLVRRYAFCALWPTQVEGHIDFNSLPLLNRHGLVALQLIRDSLMLDSEYRKASILFVGLHLSTPDRWPSLFGNIRDLYTVRNFWGRVWHQIFRQIFTRCGDVVANALDAQKGTLLYKYSRLYVGFLVSGVQHYACALLIPSAGYGWGMFWQMPGYAAVITVEDILKYYGKEAGIQDSTFVRFLGYIWTAYWMTLIYALPVGFVSDIGGFTGVCAA